MITAYSLLNAYNLQRCEVLFKTKKAKKNNNNKQKQNVGRVSRLSWHKGIEYTYRWDDFIIIPLLMLHPSTQIYRVDLYKKKEQAKWITPFAIYPAHPITHNPLIQFAV